MARTRTTDANGPQRFQTQARKMATTKLRSRWRTRTRTAQNQSQRTASRAAAIKEKRQARNQEYNEALQEAREMLLKKAEELQERFGKHTVQWYFEDIVQHSRIVKLTRRPNKWNAYLRSEVKRINDGVNDGNCKKATELSSEIAASWNSMSPTEQATATEGMLDELTEQREMKQLSLRHHAADAFQDARITIATLEREIHALHSRTGTELLLFAVRSSPQSFLKPYIVYTSDCAPNFFTYSMSKSIDDVIVKFEGFCLSGAQGMVSNYAQEVLLLKQKTAALISSKLGKSTLLFLRIQLIFATDEATGTRNIQMNYQNFAGAITMKYGVVVENWPLPRFCSPSDLKTLNEVKVLHSSWESKSTRFHRMPTREFEQWKINSSRGTTPNTRPDSLEIHAAVGGDHSPEIADNGTLRTEEDHAPRAAYQDVGVLPGTLPPSQPIVPQQVSSTANPNSQPTCSFRNTTVVTTTNGGAIMVAAKPRKQRSDKGVKRGPIRGRKKPTAGAQQRANVAEPSNSPI
ncbi:hypothetical protein BD779DRAFT_1668380 [Infundibulicybe gibba]|nr:hypothetical protein BD779DRAFT_1668380 [Infundibulicybe gibba]